jgi:hypothetical protein
MTKARSNAYGTTTLGSTTVTLGSTSTSISGLTVANPTVTGTLTAASSAGTSGQLLSSTGTGVQWVAAPASGSLTLLSTTSLSGASTTISSISQSYTHLFCSWYGVNSSSGSSWYANPNGTTNITSASGVSSGSSTSYGNSQFRIAGTGDNTATSNTANGGWFWIYNYSSTSITNKGISTGAKYVDGGSSNSAENMAGAIGTASAITSLVFSASFSAGTVLLYGVN